MRLFVGTYSQSLGGSPANGEGIYEVEFDEETGSFGAVILRSKCINPSALLISESEQFLYATREVFRTENPAIESYQIEKNGALKPIFELELEGELPCHLSAHETRIASSQYGSGDVVIFDMSKREINAPSSTFTRIGSGPNLERQEGPHAHYSTFTDDGKYLHLIDLGSDLLVTHDLNTATETHLQFPRGSGPRHMVVSQNEQSAYVICELSETLIQLTRFGDSWKILDTVQVFGSKKTDGAAAAIRLSQDEKYLYISGRHQSSIACFEIGEHIKKISETPTNGEWPRDFIITSDGNWIIVANQISNELVSFRCDLENGTLAYSGHRCQIGSPVAIVELPTLI